MGPFPPPVHGFSVITDKLATFSESFAITYRFNRSPRFLYFKKLGSVISFFSAFFEFLRALFRDRPDIVYIGVSSGFGVFFDLCFLIFARLFGIKLVLHLHNFSYIDNPSFKFRIFFHLSKSVKILALCQCMGVKLISAYGLDPKSIRVLSNAAFVESQYNVLSQSLCLKSGLLSLGYLSNITREKGIFKFLEMVELLESRGVKFLAIIGGPLSSDIKDEFMLRIAGNQFIEYRGALYGDAKDEFYRSIDYLCFPTNYPNEAEPVVVWEAASFGVTTIAARRGCLEEQVSFVDGVVYDYDGYAISACNFFCELSIDDILDLRMRRVDIANKFLSFKRRNLSLIESIFI